MHEFGKLADRYLLVEESRALEGLLNHGVGEQFVHLDADLMKFVLGVVACDKPYSASYK
jgi:hypothetical protein